VTLRVGICTIFPDVIEGYCATSIVGRARSAGQLELSIVDLRSGATDQRRTVDDSPFGGGAGMVLAPEPVFAAIEAAQPPRPLLLMSPSGRRLDQAYVLELAGLGGFSLLCGRYEGIDERIAAELCDGEVSIGDYVLAGGELAALVVLEAAVRHVPGVLGNAASPEDESFTDGLLEYPQYTRPQVFREMTVPEILVSGDHGRVAAWRRAASLWRTIERRPDLIEQRGGLSEDEARLLVDHGYPVDAATPDQAMLRVIDAGKRAAEEHDEP
jgi:tRNA (guanine37-N1)-methyltransferase